MGSILRKLKQTIKMEITAPLMFVTFIFSTGFSQKFDYETMRENKTILSCGPKDSLSIVLSNLELRNIDTNFIDKNLDLYYSDLGWSYYLLYLHTKDETKIGKSIGNYKKSYHHKPNASKTCWQLSFLYYWIGDCATGKYYLKKYKSVTDKKYWQEDQIKAMKKNCED